MLHHPMGLYTVNVTLAAQGDKRGFRQTSAVESDDGVGALARRSSAA